MSESTVPGGNGKKDFSLTFIQVVCSFSVIALHANGCFWSFSATERYWYSANIIECVFYFAVPVFFMITGITLLDYRDRYSTKEYFKKRARKTLLPYIAWSVIGVLFLVATKRIAPGTLTAKWLINGLLSTDGIISIYWFFQPLFCIYLSIPLFSAIDRRKKTNVIKYLLLTGFVFNILSPFLISILNRGIAWPYRISVVSGYLFWPLAGYLIYNNPPRWKHKTVIFILSVVGLLLHIIGTYSLSISAGSIQSLYKGYNNVPCVLYSLGVFLLLKDMAGIIEKVDWLRNLINIMGKYTFSSYLIHWFVLQGINLLFAVDTKSISYRLLMPFAVYFSVMGFVWCLRKIPVVKKIVP